MAGPTNKARVQCGTSKASFMIYNRPEANFNRQLSIEFLRKSVSGARAALFLLLTINLFNYIDRQILAAVEPDIRASFFAPGDVNAMTKTGLLGDAFFVTYMISAPILGLLADRISRWMIVGSAVILWSLASGGSVWRRHSPFCLSREYGLALAKAA